MDWELIIKLATLLLGTVGAAKLIYEIVVNKRTIMRNDYEFSRDFLAEVTSKPEMHPYLKETGYQALAGHNEVNAAVIEYLLSLERPDRSLRDYMFGRRYLEHRPQSTHGQVNFQRKYQSDWARRWRKQGSFLLYGLFVLLAVSPILISPFFAHQKIMWPTFVVSFLLCGAYAIFFLMVAIRIVRAERLVRHQQPREK